MLYHVVLHYVTSCYASYAITYYVTGGTVADVMAGEGQEGEEWENSRAALLSRDVVVADADRTRLPDIEGESNSPPPPIVPVAS